MKSEIKNTWSQKTMETTTGVAHQALKNTMKNFGMIPNMYAGMANNPALIDSYTHSYQSFRKHSQLTAEEQEIVFITLSVLNNCHYCKAAHSTVAKLINLPEKVLANLKSDQPLDNPKWQGLRKLTQQIHSSRGNVSPAMLEAFLDLGYEHVHVMAVITAVGIKVFSNYFNHIYQPKLDDVFAQEAWETSGRAA